jgi:hypothetical protein
MAWRRLVNIISSCAEECGWNQQLERLAAARAACAGAAFPVAGEAAKACANALLELVRTLPRTSGREQFWHGESLLALAVQCLELMREAGGVSS